MIKRTLMIAALGVALLGGTARVTHATGTAAPQLRADVVLASVGDQTADTDATAPCTGQGTAAEAGHCTDSQNTAAPEDSTGAPDEGASSHKPFTFVICDIRHMSDSVPSSKASSLDPSRLEG